MQAHGALPQETGPLGPVGLFTSSPDLNASEAFYVEEAIPGTSLKNFAFAAVLRSQQPDLLRVLFR